MMLVACLITTASMNHYFVTGEMTKDGFVNIDHALVELELTRPEVHIEECTKKAFSVKKRGNAE